MYVFICWYLPCIGVCVRVYGFKCFTCALLVAYGCVLVCVCLVVIIGCVLVLLVLFVRSCCNAVCIGV